MFLYLFNSPRSQLTQSVWKYAFSSIYINSINSQQTKKLKKNIIKKNQQKHKKFSFKKKKLCLVAEQNSRSVYKTIDMIKCTRKIT